MIVCPFCDSNAKEMLPEYVIGQHKLPAFELFEQDGDTWIRRNKYPRFTGRVTMGVHSDIEDVDILDNCTDAKELANAIRKAGEFLLRNCR